VTDPSDWSTFGPLVDTTVSVATWNLWWRFGPWEERLAAILATLERLDPDVLCLQEVWREADDSSATRVAEHLGDRHVVHSPGLDIDGVGFGNAIVSRWPIAGSDWRALSEPAEHAENRTVLRADIDGPRGVLRVFCTHLHWRLDHSHVRQQQVRETCEFVSSSPDRTFPAVLCGDLNADPSSDELRMLTGRATVPVPPLVFWDAWEMAGDGPGNTWSNANPFARLELDIDRRIDFVLSGFPKPGGRGACTRAGLVGTEPVDGVFPSDHYGVVAELRY
jgi:endonuclease/exonuclease/phosphatase family metal-dependent hydrolase